EDAIRDFHVTGVQTCALPISVPMLPRHHHERQHRHRHWLQPHDVAADIGKILWGRRFELTGRADLVRRISRKHLVDGGRVVEERSEERRVGKERRARWWGAPW